MTLYAPRMGVFALAIGAISGCSDNLCANENIRAISSPDGLHVAYLFRRDCGATTRYSTQVSVLNADIALPNEGGNVLVLGNEQPLQVSWANALTLKVTGLQAPIYRQVANVDGIAIDFR